MKKNIHLILIFNLLFTSIFINAQNTTVYNLLTGGTLSQLTENEIKTITDLTLSGELDNTDLQIISKMTSLKILNLKNAKIETFANSFFSGKTIETLILPDELTSISQDLFKNFTGNIILPKNLEVIKNNAFYQAKLKSLDFTNCANLKEIGTNVFTNTTIGTNNIIDLQNNSNLVSFIKNGSSSTFNNFTGTIILPDNLKTIPQNLFSGFKGKITLPTKLETIGNQAFRNSTIDSLDFSICQNLKEIGIAAFDNISITSGNVLNFKNNLNLNTFSKSGSTSTFSNYSGKIILPDSLKTITQNLFSGFNGILELPVGLEKIDSYAFRNATIDSLDFSICQNLKEIGIAAFENISITSENILNFKSNQNLDTFSKSGSTSTFSNYNGKIILPDSLKIITQNLFSGFNGSLELPVGLEKIDSYAFRNSTVDSLDFSICQNLKEIGIAAFDNITITSGNILDFKYNQNLNTFIKSGSTSTFFNYRGKVILPDSLKTITQNLFSGFNGSLILPVSLKKIDAYAFRNATIDSLDFSICQNLKEIGIAAFDNITITSGNILDFKYNQNLDSFSKSGSTSTFFNFAGQVIFPDSLKIIPSNLFYGFSGTITLPSNLEIIRSQAFRNTKIKEINFPLSLKLIESEIFNESSQLEKISICATVPPELDANAFKGLDFDSVQLNIPKNTLSTYQNTELWNKFTMSEADLCSEGSTDEYDLYIYAANSYIYDINQATENSYGGLEISVEKAYAMWENNEYLEGKGVPDVTLSASVYWEDVEGLIRFVSIDQNGKNSKIKAMVNKAKGKGNAVIALHVGDTGSPSEDPVYWTWHVWVTDDPTQGITYDNNPGSEQHLVNSFMDRNLGALSNSFTGDDWHRSGGLMYQWGRKDPFPAFVYLDSTAPTISSLPYGKITNADYQSVIQQERPSTEIPTNIQESIKNPFKIFIPLKSEVIEVANSANSTVRVYPDSVTWVTNNLSEYYRKNNKVLNLWGDNTDGEKINAKIYTQKQKSPFDPCPSGWRVPAYAHQYIDQYDSSPWGNANTSSEINLRNSDELELIKGVKVYPGLGFDFTDATNYNIGVFPMTGHYVESYDIMSYQDQGSEAYLWSATLNEWGSVSMLHLIADYLQNDQNGRYRIYTRDITSGHTTSLNAIRCIKEENTVLESPTVYIQNDNKEYSEGIDNPNSYLVVKSTTQQEINIPVNKAYAVYNQYLTNNQWIEGKLSANVLWTTDTSLIKSITLNGNEENGIINVIVNPNMSGNAVISIHAGDNGNSSDQIIWSWHIWVPNSDPTATKITYTTEEQYSKASSDYLAFNTLSGSVPITTTFMDRNIGATEYDTSSTDKNIYNNTRGYLFQWGRKDPLPVFFPLDYGSWGVQDIFYFGSTTSGSVNYSSQINNIEDYEANYVTTSWEDTLEEVLTKSINNPFTFLHRDSDRSWLPDVEQKLWGHADKKSPFDPCPEGWRIPDFTGANVPGSPWYKQNIGDWELVYSDDSSYWEFKTLHPELDFVGGTISTNSLGVIGVSLVDPEYNIGYFPLVGARGLNVNREYYLDGLLIYGQNWSATMYGSSQSNLRPMALAFGTCKDGIDPANLVRPRTALSVRCAKDETRFTKESISNAAFKTTSSKNSITTLSTSSTELSESQISVTPNPNSGLFKVILTDIPEGVIQVTDINGNIILTKNFSSVTQVDIDIQNYSAGVYIVKVQAKNQVVAKKIIKI